MAEGAADYWWPADAVSPIDGIPLSILRRLVTPVEFDEFRGFDTASRSETQWTTNTVGSGAVSLSGTNPDTADVITDGICRVTLTASPVAAAAAAIRHSNAVAVDGFLGRPRLIAVRFQNRTVAAPSASEYAISPIELSRRTPTDTPPTEGVQIVFDPTLGVQSYILRVWSAGVPQDDTQLLLSHDNAYHVIGCLIDVDGFTPFVDGVQRSAFMPANPQPKVGCSAKAIVGRTPIGSVTNTVWDADWTALA